MLDKLDLAGVRNYDMHAFPDSDHSIYFHNANSVVYGSKLDLHVHGAKPLVLWQHDTSHGGTHANSVTLELRDWLVNAFNGEWLRIDNPQPMGMYGIS